MPGAWPSACLEKAEGTVVCLQEEQGRQWVGPRSSQENRRGPRILHLTSLDVPELGERRARPATEGQGKQRLEKIAESGTSGM